jgi:hypothetical protein
MAAQFLQIGRTSPTALKSKSALLICVNSFGPNPLRCVDLRRDRMSPESGMKRSIVAGEPWAQSCADCAVRTHAICAALDQDELRELEQPGHRLGNSKEYFEAVAI